LAADGGGGGWGERRPRAEIAPVRCRLLPDSADGTDGIFLSCSYPAARVAAIQRMAECLTPLHVADLPAGVALVPGAIELLGCPSELHDEIAGEVLRLDLASLLAP